MHDAISSTPEEDPLAFGDAGTVFAIQSSRFPLEGQPKAGPRQEIVKGHAKGIEDSRYEAELAKHRHASDPDMRRGCADSEFADI
jgi:hypothetical protein